MNHFKWVAVFIGLVALCSCKEEQPRPQGPAIIKKFEGLATTPQMGWNSWNLFKLNINERLIREVADAFVEFGLKDAGYEYIVLDDGWMAMERDAAGNFLPHPDKFPSGMKALADYVHSKGLKFGLYSSAGYQTCAGFPASLGHETQDALKFAEWGIDYFKLDWCGTEGLQPVGAYVKMRDALYAAGRPVLFSICEWGLSQPWTWASSVGHSWRTTGDIQNVFDCPRDPAFGEDWAHCVMQIVDVRDQNTLRKYAGPDHWNDMDMLEVGNTGLDFYENQSHFALWAMLHSPLILGNDVRHMSDETLQILTNREIIALSKDPAGIQAFRYKRVDDLEIWVQPLANDEWALCFLNRATTPLSFVFDWSAETIDDPLTQRTLSCSNENKYKIRDLYAGQEIGTTETTVTKSLAKHQSLVVRLRK
jgi:alpha-galactosidase